MSEPFQFSDFEAKKGTLHVYAIAMGCMPQHLEAICALFDKMPKVKSASENPGSVANQFREMLKNAKVMAKKYPDHDAVSVRVACAATREQAWNEVNHFAMAMARALEVWGHKDEDPNKMPPAEWLLRHNKMPWVTIDLISVKDFDSEEFGGEFNTVTLLNHLNKSHHKILTTRIFCTQDQEAHEFEIIEMIRQAHHSQAEILAGGAMHAIDSRWHASDNPHFVPELGRVGEESETRFELESEDEFDRVMDRLMRQAMESMASGKSENDSDKGVN